MEQENQYHYQIVRRAIDAIDAADMPLTLEALAADVGLSPAHFQRVFTQWAGVSPKRYQQYLMMDHARSLLRDRHATLDTANAVGLSGNGRLHDMFLTWEAMSPGAYAKGGEGLTIYWGWFDSPFGPALITGTDHGICGIAFGAETGRDDAQADMFSRWPKASLTHAPDRLNDWAQSAFGAATDGPKTPLYLIGAPFQLKVWEALLAIPSGHVTTYADIARKIDSPGAVRAVGTAVGRNPISWLIPCHRAIRKDGAMGGYHWGLPVKRAMLAYETIQSEAE